ncbi:Opi1-domain-containing protein [Myriangium duriaei CBS 260.36]|uniref:Opi1-domain-containing protein n=1 Tax=Myriangium duriaei CBS 260.36 TaxID=1168546 RepID=A0A9P4J0G6_9PEZI|nr:Opi1-domain-containing protein [Myriangium duriaei CBS 260.36]
MEFARERPPEYVSTNPDELRLPSVPQHEVGTVPHPAELTLPGFKSLVAGLPERPTSAIAYDSNNQSYALRADHLAKLQSQAYPRTSPGFDSTFGGQYRNSTETALMSPTETGSVMSVDDHMRRSTSVVSLEDPDVRLAAEALSGLGNPDFVRTPTASRASHRTTNGNSSTVTRDGEAQEGPLLQLLVEAHPWVGGTINGSLSAYTTTKGYTPRIVQYSANIIERNMVNTVSVVGRKTGVESGIRRYLGSRRPSDLERGDTRENHKRRKAAITGDDMDIDEADESAVDDAVSSSSRSGYDFLPAYKKNSKPPSYREEGSPSTAERQQLATRPSASRNWSTKIMYSTSGLGVALSDASLKSLTFCVTLLTKATEHVEFVMGALKLVLQDYEKAQEQRHQEQSQRAKEIEAGIIPRSQAEYEDATRQLADRIQQMCDDIMGTLKTVVDKVSTYTGSALPDNAKSLVKRQLLSIPQRWRMASQSVEQHDHGAESSDAGVESSNSNYEDAPRKAANRMIVFAQEGLDMMSQVNEVIKITLQSAEEWLNTFGRRQQPQRDGSTNDGSATAGASPAPTSDVEMDR